MFVDRKGSQPTTEPSQSPEGSRKGIGQLAREFFTYLGDRHKAKLGMLILGGPLYTERVVAAMANSSPGSTDQTITAFIGFVGAGILGAAAEWVDRDFSEMHARTKAREEERATVRVQES